MQALVQADKEPIRPLVGQIRALAQQQAVSVVMVMGGSGDFFSEADRVLMLDNYQILDVSEAARGLATAPQPPAQEALAFTPRAAPRPECLNGRSAQGKLRIQAFGTRLLRFGEEELDLNRVEQLVDVGQLRTIGWLLQRLGSRKPSSSELAPLLVRLLDEVEAEGLDGLTPFLQGNLALPRLQELAAVLNRLRTLQLT